MPNDTLITIVGYVVYEPELKRINGDNSLINITIASTPSRYDKATSGYIDGETMFIRGTAWRNLAENIALTVRKGSLVIAQGKLVSKSYEKNGEKKTNFELDITELGLGLSRTAKAPEEFRPQPETDAPF
jgi:single-strand DNA-binding protein